MNDAKLANQALPIQKGCQSTMALQNRVTADGQIVAAPARGTLMGNRGGMMHRLDKSLGPKRWVSKQWISCRLSYKGRWREVMGPNSYTELFFLDEATSFSAGHRPCYECRRREAVFFAELWGERLIGAGRAKAGDIDATLHAERLNAEGRKATFKSLVADLPTGAMVRWRDGAYLVLAGRLLRWSLDGYTAAVDVDPDLIVDVLTPRSTLEVFRAGYDADLHESALKFM
jgi:hypothetical protein